MSIEVITRNISSIKKSGIDGIKLSLSEMVSISEEYKTAENAIEQANQAVLAASETIQKLVAENAELKSRTVKVPTKVYVKDMKSNVVRWAQVIDALSDAGIAFVRDDGELIAGTRETPATDAAFAEIKAQGVDEAAESAPWLYGSQMGVQVEAVPREELIKFAANLRAGRKG